MEFYHHFIVVDDNTILYTCFMHIYKQLFPNIFQHLQECNLNYHTFAISSFFYLIEDIKAIYT